LAHAPATQEGRNGAHGGGIGGLQPSATKLAHVVALTVAIAAWSAAAPA
jgi:hypothetical protein